MAKAFNRMMTQQARRRLWCYQASKVQEHGAGHPAQAKARDMKSVAQTEKGVCAQHLTQTGMHCAPTGRQLVDTVARLHQADSRRQGSSCDVTHGCTGCAEAACCASTGELSDSADHSATADRSAEGVRPMTGGWGAVMKTPDPHTSYPPTSKPGFFFPLQQKPGKNRPQRTPMSGRSLDEPRISINRAGSTAGATLTIKYENRGTEK